MSNVLAIQPQQGGALALSEGELIDVLQSSLYPGAAVPSIKMVIGYCKAAGLDPMKKPVHIVPMWDSKAKQMRDVIMPGVGLYRTDAARTGAFAGQTEPEFGPMITDTLGGAHITYPEWAKVTVKKIMPNGLIAEFTAVEYWIENYATKGGPEKSIAPNAMWTKRPRGQIAKCAAAQALRLAFPEGGAQPTAEEMEGKSFNDFEGTTIDAGTGEIVGGKKAEERQKDLPALEDSKFAELLPQWHEAIRTGKAGKGGAEAVIAKTKTKYTLTAEQEAAIRAPIASAKASEENASTPLTYADVADKMTSAFTLPELDEAAALIQCVPEEKQRAELTAMHAELTKGMKE
ncbi:phage recombination protein Bet [Variovorax sp. JS1663]|uniref:phage recombination protein Bet n=1 Tax=Variovorax sp. JS1663 TaxID=1851577 RepID=UPI000B34869F|nr:phage recombination protein Bet [Variovorax sp. JS1663]OUM00538.1 phage recombination protein Bet [Variovorax sp. JS1663]